MSWPVGLAERNWRDPAIRARAIAGIRRVYDDPLYYAVHVATQRRNFRRFPDERIVELKRRYVPGDRRCGARALAREFGMHPNTVYYIVARGWKHLDD